MRWLQQVAEVIRPRWVGYAGALAAVGVMSAVIWFLLGRTQLANISMLYLAAVLAAAVAFGRGPAILAAVAAFLTFDYLFTVPYFTLTVSDPEEWFALLLFLVTAICTGQLAAALRLRAREARQREHEAVILYDLSHLLGDPDLDAALSAVAERIRQELQLAAVSIQIGANSNQATRSAAAGDRDVIDQLSAAGYAQLLGEGPAPSATRRGEPGRWIRIVPTR